jgi:hypothetical protein
MLVVAALSITTGALAKEPKPAKGSLICFADGGATCVVDSTGQSARLDVPGGGSAGVYKNGTGVGGKPVGELTFSFDYLCDTADPCVAGGSPRWSIPIDTGKGGPKGLYAFVGANNCVGQAGGSAGTVDNNCGVNFNNVDYPDWAAFVAAHPTYKVGKATTFVIADQPFNGTISNYILHA